MNKELLDRFHIEDIKNPLHPSVFFKHENYDLFILRLPFIDKSNNLIYQSNAFIITDENYYHYDKTDDEFKELDHIKGFYKMLDRYVDNTMNLVSKYLGEIEVMEDRIYEGKSIREFNKQWFKNKNDMVRINRVLYKALESVTSLIHLYKQEDDYLERNFEDIQEHLQRAHRNSELMLEKLDSIYNFNQTQTNEQMNRIVYILTLLSGIFLPLNLIVGFFGMNTTSLPFTQGDGGTYNVLMVLGISAIFATLITFLMRKKY